MFSQNDIMDLYMYIIYIQKAEDILVFERMVRVQYRALFVFKATHNTFLHEENI